MRPTAGPLGIVPAPPPDGLVVDLVVHIGVVALRHGLVSESDLPLSTTAVIKILRGIADALEAHHVPRRSA